MDAKHKSEAVDEEPTIRLLAVDEEPTIRLLAVDEEPTIRLLAVDEEPTTRLRSIDEEPTTLLFAAGDSRGGHRDVQQGASSGGNRGHFPPLRLALWIMLTFGLGLVAAIALPIGASLIVVLVTLIVGLWARQRGGLLVSALAILLVSLPFNVTVSRFGVSPQELLLYAIWLGGALFSPLGARRWLVEVLSSLSPISRFAILLFALAAGQSVFRLANLNLITVTTSLRQIVVYPTLLAFIVAYTARTRRCTPTLLQAFTLGAALLAFYALALRALNVGIGIGAVAGRLGAEASLLAAYHPNNLGLYLVFGLAFAPALILRAVWTRSRSDVKLIAACVGLTFMLIALWLTYSRGALLALLASGAVFLAGMIFASKRKWFFLFSVASAAALTVVVLIVGGRSFLGRYLQLLDPGALAGDPSVQFRLDLFARAWSLIQAHPLTGVGLGGYSQGSVAPYSPHDTYLDVLVSMGVFGAVALVLVVGTGLTAALRSFLKFRALGSPTNAAYLLGVAVALVGFLVQAVTESFTGNLRIFPAVWFLVACAQGTQLVVLPRLQRSGSRSDRPKAIVGRDDTQSPMLNADEVTRSSSLFPSEALWALDTAPMPVINSIEIPAPDSFGDLADLPTKRIARPNGVEPFDAADAGRPFVQSGVAGVLARERAASKELLLRAPQSFVWNQAYTLWFFAMNFLLSVIIARQLTQQEYGAFSILSTILTTLLFFFSFGLEDVATIFMPRVLSAGGEGAAGTLVRRLLLGRVLVLGGVAAALAILAPWGTSLLASEGASEAVTILAGPYGSSVRIALMGAYLVGSGVVALENALFASVLRSRTTLIVGGFSQALNLALAALILWLGGGVEGLLLVLGGVAWLTALAYLIPLRRLLVARGRGPIGLAPAMRGLMVTAWLANVTNGALGKQSDILLMGVFAVGYAAIGYYNLAYQLANILGVLLIAGLGGVGPAAMSAALSVGGRYRLAGVWRETMMLQIVLTVPLLAFGAVQADAIVSTLYGERYAGAVPLLQVFLVVTLVGRLIGGGVQQSALYVLGRQRLVLVSRWLGLVINIGLDIVLIPMYGAYGALAATSGTLLLIGAAEHLLVRGNLPVRYPLAFAGRVVGASTLAAVCVLWWQPRDVLGLAASFVVFLLAVVAVLFVLGRGDSADAKGILELRPGLQAPWERLWNRTLRERDAGPAHDGGETRSGPAARV